MRRYVIIGMGVAGMAAAEAIRARDRDATISLVGDDPYGFYSKPGLAYYLTGELPEKQLLLNSKQDWQELNLTYVKGRAVNILPQEHLVDLGTAEALPYDRLLLATGATAVQLNAPGADLDGVVKLDHFEDARRILRLARKARVAVVVGGGITALELAEGLARRKVAVHYFLRGNRYWGNVLDEVESRIVEKRLEEEGIRLHYQTELAEVLGRRGKVTGVRSTSGETIHCGMVAVGIGIRPRLELAQTTGLRTERGILVNEYMQSSEVDIFAAGDVAQVYDPLARQFILDSLWNPAREQGSTAGANMAGQTQAYRKTAPFNVTRLAGLTTTIIGAVGGGRDDDLVSIARGDSETWRLLPNAIAREVGEAVNHMRLMVGEQTLLGALVMGDQTLSRPLQELIAAQVDITPLRSALLAPDNTLGDRVMDFWKAWRTNVS
jgi:NAD(P)H-nitrite reductase large subunit